MTVTPEACNPPEGAPALSAAVQDPGSYTTALEGPYEPLEQCVHPEGCFAVNALYAASAGPGVRDECALANDPLPASRGARLVQAVDAEAQLNGKPRCLRCPLRRVTNYPAIAIPE